jgi:hypothetical protein
MPKYICTIVYTKSVPVTIRVPEGTAKQDIKDKAMTAFENLSEQELAKNSEFLGADDVSSVEKVELPPLLFYSTVCPSGSRYSPANNCDREDIMEKMTTTKKPLLRTCGLRYRNPTTYLRPSTMEEIKKALDWASGYDIVEKENCFEIDYYGATDLD